MDTERARARGAVVAAVRTAAEPVAWIRALWEGGSASFGRADEWSDVDLGVAVEDGRVEEGFAVVEQALEALAGIEFAWRINPATDVKPQRMYRLRSGDAFPLVDVGVFPSSTPPAARFVERRRHGTPRVLFDRDGFTGDVPSDPAAWRARLKARAADLACRVEMMQGYALKAARRGDVAEAVAFYQAFTLRPLVEILRIRHDPWRHDFDVRYLRHDLPADIRRRVDRLWLVRDLGDLVAKRAEADVWFRQVLRELRVDRIRL